MNVPYFRNFPSSFRLWLHPYFLTEAAEVASNELADAYKHDRFRVWRFIGAL